MSTTPRKDWDEKGWEHVSDYMYNYDKEDGEKDFVTKLANEIEELAYK